MKTHSKLLMGLVVAAGLGGCAVYPAPGYGPYESYGAPYGTVYGGQGAPAYISGSVTYEQNFGGGGYYGGRGWRDRDGDGIANRNDRDRDGDGIRNRRDGRPNNPNRR